MNSCHHCVLNSCLVFKGCSTVPAAAGRRSLLFHVLKRAGYIHNKSSPAPAELWSVIPSIFIPQFSLPDGFWISGVFSHVHLHLRVSFHIFQLRYFWKHCSWLHVWASSQSACCCPFMCCHQYVWREAGHLAIKKQNKTNLSFMNVILNMAVSRTVPKRACLGACTLRSFYPWASLIFSLLIFLDGGSYVVAQTSCQCCAKIGRARWLSLSSS